MKNDGHPIRDSVPWNFRCIKDPRWLKNVFLFNTEIWADQSKKPPCITFISFFLRIFYSVDGLMSPSRWLMWCQKVSTSVPRNTSFDHTLPEIARDTHSECKHVGNLDKIQKNSSFSSWGRPLQRLARNEECCGRRDPCYGLKLTNLDWLDWEKEGQTWYLSKQKSRGRNVWGKRFTPKNE